MFASVLHPKFKSGSVSKLSSGYDNVAVNRATQRSHGPSVCNLCGTVGAVVECEKCESMAFCSTCDDMYHRHPKRRFHLRKSLLCDKTSTQTRSGIDFRSIAGKIFSKASNETKPKLNASFSGLRDAAAHPSKMPIPPPRRKKKDATLQRGMIPSIMQKFGNSNFRRFQLNESSKKSLEMPQQQQQTNQMYTDPHSQRSHVRAASLHQVSAPFNEQRRSSYQSLTGSDVSADPWCQESQFDCIPPPLPQKMRSSQMLARRNLSLTDLCDYNEPNMNPYFGYPQPHFMPPWMHSSLAHSIDDFGDDDDQNSVSEYNSRGTLTQSSSRNNGQSTMRRTQSFMQMNPWAMQHYPPYYYYPPYYPPPPPQFYRNQGSPPSSLRSMSVRRHQEDDRGSNISLSVRDSASVRSENITKVPKTKAKSKPKAAKSMVNVKVPPVHSYIETRRLSSNSLTRDLSDSEEVSENESDDEQEEEEEEEEKYESFSEDFDEEEDLLSHGSLVDLSTEWTCKYCTFVNRPECDICEVCAKSNAKRLAMKKQLEDRNTKNESRGDDKKEEPKSTCVQKTSVSDTNIVITKEMIDEQKRVEREIRRRILNEKRIAKENERIEKREQQKVRRKTLGSIDERGMVSEAVKAIDQKTKSEEKIPMLPLSATIDNNNTPVNEPLPECGSSPKVDNLSTEVSREEVKKKKKVKKVTKKAVENKEQTQGLLKIAEDSTINQSQPVAYVNESHSKVSSNGNAIIENCKREKATTKAKNNEFSSDIETNQSSNIETSDSINQTNHLKNGSQTVTQTSETIHYQTREQQPIKPDPVPQIASHTENVVLPPQPQQYSPQPFTPPPMFPQQMNAINTPLHINTPQQYQNASQPQLYSSYQDTRRASLGSLPYGQMSPMSPSYSVPNSSFDLQLNNQYVAPPSQYVGSMSRIDQVVTGGMNAFGPIGSPIPMDNYGGYTQQMPQNNYNQRYSRNDFNSLASTSSLGNHFQPNLKSGFEVLKVLREAERKGFTAEDVEIAFNFSPENAMEWLEINWSNMVETVLTLGNNQMMQNEKKRGVSKKALLQIPLITECEAKEALRNARGNIWQAIEKCVQRKEEQRHTGNGNESGSKAKSFTLKISELGAGRDNFDQNTERTQNSSKAEEVEKNSRLAKIEEMVESWKKDLIEGKKSKEEFLNIIEDLVKQKIAFIDETLARRKSISLEEEVRKRFIEEFFSDEELDEKLFVREDTINVVDEKGNVVCVKDAYKESGSELSKEELRKKLRDKGFFIGDEKPIGDKSNEVASCVQNTNYVQMQSDTLNSKGKKCVAKNDLLSEASKLISEINATLKQSLDRLDVLDTNERTDVIDTRANNDQSDETNIVASESNSHTESNVETKTEETVTQLSQLSAEVEQSVGENEDKFEDAKEHITLDYTLVTNDNEVDDTSNVDSEIESKNEINDLNSNVEVADEIEEKNDESIVKTISIDEPSNEIKEESSEKSDALAVDSSANSDSVPKEENKSPSGTKLPRKTYDCELCTGSFRLAEMVTMPSCEHSACIECLQQYFTVQIREKQKVIIPCPYCNQPEISPEDEDAVCNYLSILDQLLKVLLPDDLHELFQRKVRDRTLQKDPSFRWCSQCSSGFLACDPNAKTITCPDCKAITCSQCKSLWQKQHIGISCEKFAEWKKANDPKFAEQFIDNHLRQFGIDCPQCKFHYELARGGCIHFHCVQCGHDFCGFCQMPFKMGDKCNQSEWCKKLGFHAHHPRNCLFYLRDRDINDLKKLLDMHKIKYARDTKELSKSKKKCPVMEQKWKIGEPQTGLIDASCGKEVFSDGMCKSHYTEYLTELIRANKVDPVEILDEDEMVHLLRRANLKIPIKMNPKQHIINLRQVIQEELPLC